MSYSFEGMNNIISQRILTSYNRTRMYGDSLQKGDENDLSKTKSDVELEKEEDKIVENQAK